MFFDLPPVLVKKLAPKACAQHVDTASPPMPFSLASGLADPVNTVSGIRTVNDLPMPRDRGLYFHTMFPAFWQLPLIKHLRGAYTLLEFG